ncbi:MAG: putative Dual specificity protein phosphatase CDC14A [Streblomastix strix]|uniref:protein-tyrosine-phosphatase n=1 Tax=Streblomastix strix TaxID=222440 RepID=A0A5J4W779_9EUKA|nr:MAG: putative Dual specificity protein phosphatase CDC14A [Streblomastix strix]
MTSTELSSAVEIIKDRFYFVVLRSVPRNTSNAFYFSTDNSLIYQPFSSDFGPLNMACLYRFCCAVEDYLKQTSQTTKKIYYYCSNDQHKKANSVTLVCCYAVLYLGATPDEAYRPFLRFNPPLPPFRDASYGPSTYSLSVLDVVRGIAKGQQVGFIDFQGGKFNLNEYERYEKVENGDMNWIVPGKFIAFSGPSNTEINQSNGICTHTPEFYLPFFRKSGVTAVVRLNKKMYDRRRFVDKGINHYDLYFVDGGIPTEAIVKKFLEICEEEKGVISVHCKAGLGRTGTLIGCYMMKHYGFTATEVMGYVRICRPGSIIGPQQHFLIDIQNRMHKLGEEYRNQRQLYDTSSTLDKSDSEDINTRIPQRIGRSSLPQTAPSSFSSLQQQSSSQQSPYITYQTQSPNRITSSIYDSRLNTPKIERLDSETRIIDSTPSPLRGPMKHLGSQLGYQEGRSKYEGGGMILGYRDQQQDDTQSEEDDIGQGRDREIISKEREYGIGSSGGYQARNGSPYRSQQQQQQSTRSSPSSANQQNRFVSIYSSSYNPDHGQGTTGTPQGFSHRSPYSSGLGSNTQQQSSPYSRNMGSSDYNGRINSQYGQSPAQIGSQSSYGYSHPSSTSSPYGQQGFVSPSRYGAQRPSSISSPYSSVGSASWRK